MRRFLTKKFIIEALIWIVGGIAIFGVAGALRGPQETQEDEERVLSVSTATAQSRNEVVIPLKTSGQITAKQSTAVRTLVQGTVLYLLPVGSKTNLGTPLFRLSNSSIEAGYFTALSTYSNAQSGVSQTTISAGTSLSQATLSVSQTEINLESAKQKYADALISTTLAQKQAEDNARVTYDVGYSLIESVMRYLGGPTISLYIFRDVLSFDFNILGGTILPAYDSSKTAFGRLAQTPSNDLSAGLSQMEAVLFDVKVLTNGTNTMLAQALPVNGYTQAELDASLAQVGMFVSQLNTIDTQIKNSRNNLRNVAEQNSSTISGMQKAVELAELSLKNAQTAYEIQAANLELSRLGSASQLNSAGAQLAAARFQYENLSLAAPFAGTVISHKTSLGSQVSPGSEIMEIGDLNLIEIRIEVSPDTAQAIRLGQVVTINGDKQGRISEIEAAGSIATGVVGVTIEADNTSGQFIPGSSGEIELMLSYPTQNTYTVPLKSVVVTQNASYIFLVRDGQAERREVRTGRIFGEFIEITEGLTEGDIYIVSSPGLLQAGDRVEIQN